MKLFNTLARQNEAQDFTPLKPPHVGIYSCGPTVYDHIHIGNLSAFIAADTLRRVLSAEGFAVRHIMNLTDVDNKTIDRSRQTYPNKDPKQALHQLTMTYSDIFLQDMVAVGNDTTAVEFKKATDPASIAAMQQLIGELVDRGFAYLAEDGIYFSIQAYQAAGKVYGQLSRITPPRKAQARIANDEYDKESAGDFALWKTAKSGEPSWEFTIAGRSMPGRPGWHIECSAMSTLALGQPFDIHTGGIDLIFPHHENEIAQSTATTEDSQYAQFFMHNEHTLVDGQKMSKSLQNFYTLQDLQAKELDPLAFRLLVLQSHYRSQVHFTWDNMYAAQARLLRLQNFAALRYQANAPAEKTGNNTFATPANTLLQHIQNCLANDLDTPSALAAAEEFMSLVEKTELSAALPLIITFTKKMDALFGLQLGKVEDIPDQAKELIKRRWAARTTKKWAEADALRGQLKTNFRLGLNDTSTGSIWYRL